MRQRIYTCWILTRDLLLAVWSGLRRTTSAVHALPLVAACLIGLALAGIGQFFELYISYLEDIRAWTKDPLGWRLLPSLIALVLMSLVSVTLYVANEVLGRFRLDSVFLDQHGSDIDQTLRNRVRFFGVVAAVLPWIGALWGISEAIGLSIQNLDHLELARRSFGGALQIASIDLDELLTLRGWLQDVQAKLGILSFNRLWKLHWALQGVIAFTVLVVAISLIAFRLALRELFDKCHAMRSSTSDRPVLSRVLVGAAGAHDGWRWLQLSLLPALGRPVRRFCFSLIVLLALGNLLVPVTMESLLPPVVKHASALSSYIPSGSARGPGFSWNWLHGFACGWSSWTCLPSTLGVWAASLIVTLALFMLVVVAPRRLWQSIGRHAGRRIKRGLAAVLLVAVFATVVSGFNELGWVPIARAFGPLAMAIAFCLVVLTLLVAICVVSRDTGIPLLLALVGLTWMVVSIKKEQPHSLLLADVVLLAMAFVLFATRRTAASWITACVAAIAVFGTVKHWDKLLVEPMASVAQKQAKIDGKTAIPLSHVVASFDAWYAARKEALKAYADLNPGKPYPVFVIAAEGGGIYAAAVSSSFLARMQDRCASFAQHVFAISGVSGGAVGAATFHGAAANDLVRLQQEGCRQPAASPAPADRNVLQGKVARTIRDDHLSPIVGLIVPDMLGLFSDRTIGLEQSLKVSMDEHLGRPADPTTKAAWNDRFMAHWTPLQASPALVLNTTWVRVGNRVPFAPFDLDPAIPVTLNTFGKLGIDKSWAPEHANVGLVEAAVVSARFPGMVPAYEVKGLNDLRWQFVDGGYVDASGALTAYELYSTLKAEQDRRQRLKVSMHAKDSDPPVWNIDLRLVMLTSTQSKNDTDGVKGADLKDFTAPLLAMLNVRSLLSRIAVRETIGKLDPQGVASIDKLEHPSQKGEPYRGGETPNWPVTIVELDQENFKLQLGWKISGLTHDVISLQLGQADLCARPKTDDVSSKSSDAIQVVDRIRANSCVMASIEKLLTGGRIATASETSRGPGGGQ